MIFCKKCGREGLTPYCQNCFDQEITSWSKPWTPPEVSIRKANPLLGKAENGITFSPCGGGYRIIRKRIGDN